MFLFPVAQAFVASLIFFCPLDSTYGCPLPAAMVVLFLFFCFFSPHPLIISRLFLRHCSVQLVQEGREILGSIFLLLSSLPGS